MRERNFILVQARDYEFQKEHLYTLETVSHLTATSRRMILHYLHKGLIRPARNIEKHGILFDDDTVYKIRRMEELRVIHEISLSGIKMIMNLIEEVDSLKSELRFWRG